MLRWLTDVIRPYTNSKPAALLVVTFAAHLTPSVYQAALSINLQLIKLHRGMTSTLQPLDVFFSMGLCSNDEEDLESKQTIEAN